MSAMIRVAIYKNGYGEMRFCEFGRGIVDPEFIFFGYADMGFIEEQPKKKVKKWRWVYGVRSNYMEYGVTSELYKNQFDYEARNGASAERLISPIKETMIEVEE